MAEISGAKSPEKKRGKVIIVIAASISIYVLLVGYHTYPYDHNLSSLIRIGATNPFFDPSSLEAGLVVFDDPNSGGDGYDGQFFYYTIKNLIMGEKGIPNPFRYQRILYPLASYVLAFGRSEYLPFSMLMVNLIAIAVSALILWKILPDASPRPVYLFLYTLNVGFLIAVFYDVATPLCVSLLVATAFFYDRRNFWLTSIMMALSLLTQENGAVVLAALCLWMAGKKDWRGLFILAMAAAPWAFWQLWLWQAYGNFVPLMSGNHFRPPFFGMVSQLASLHLPGGWLANLRELSVYPFMAFVILLLIVAAFEMKKRPSGFMLVLLLHALAGVCFNKEQIWGSTITSPARTLAGVFPFIIICFARQRSTGLRLLIIVSALLTLIGTARILLMPPHPYFVFK